ncbi:TPM domain-containing protein [Mucilaginibacter sp. PAMB04274]|uniref:TPM domain-containing protein n=1 Tax=Mucilaginibacter sp. PAMB04274 TaxID=3138568 RepID=UPI0031F67227
MAFNEEEQQLIRQAIERAEKNTSGEIRVAVENTCSEDPLDRAATYFYKLDMDKTKLRNGVLIYLAAQDHKFAIIGDGGINQAVPDNFWDETKEAMLNCFKQGNLAQGVTTGIDSAGRQLKQYFPFDETGDKNELSDDIAFMDGE